MKGCKSPALADAYKAEREKRGTQAEVADMLGVSRVCLARRETGARAVNHEAWLALQALPKKRVRAVPSVGRAAAGVGAKKRRTKKGKKPNEKLSDAGGGL